MDKLYIYTKEILENIPKSAEIKQLPKNKKIIVVSPHSDDVSISLGGTVNILAKENKIIPILFFTGHRGVAGESERIATSIRENEMQAESKILGTEPPVFLRLKSYNKEAGEAKAEEILKIEQIIAKEKPDVIFLPKKDDLQPRHKLATQITLKALKQPNLKTGAKKPILFFYENPWSLFEAHEFNVVFILPKKNVLNKIEAVKQHISQLKRTQFDKAALSLAAFRGSVILEQRVFGYGNEIEKDFDMFIEAFKYEA